jgi:hypothetical protein
VDLQRLAGQRALHEAWDDVPVLAALPRPDRVEQARDHGAQAPLLAQREREELVEGLGIGVRPALRGRGPVDPLRVLREGNVFGMVPVDLRARGHEHRPLEAGAVVEYVLRALDVREQRPARLLDDEADSDGRREVVDGVDAVHELADDGRREHGIDDEMKLPTFAEVRHVRLRPCRKVVESENLPALVQQQLGQVGADEPRSPRDESAPFHTAAKPSSDSNPILRRGRTPYQMPLRNR